MADEHGKDLVDETTGDAKDSAEEIVEKGKEVVSDGVAAAEDAAGNVGEKAEDAVDAVGETAAAIADKGKEVAGDAAEAVSEKAGEAVDKGKEVIGDAAGAVSGSAGAAADKVGDAFESVSEAFDGDGDSGSVLKWLLPLLLLGLLLVLLYMFFGRPATDGTATNTNASNSTNSEAGAEAVDSSLNIAAKDGKYSLTGEVPDEKTKADILKEAEAVWGSGNVDVSGVTVNANAKPFKEGWWDGFKSLLPDLKAWKDGSIGWAGGAIKTVGDIPGSVADRIKALFEGWSLPVSIAGAEDTAKAANEKAMEMLADADSVEKVIAGLNAAIINFASGKSDVPEDAKPILAKAAEVLKAQPAGSVIEVGGHTDNVGNAESNLSLSTARADSVRKALIELGVSEKMLVSKGYGDTNPKGENDTEEGRFANRRIEYKVSGGSADESGKEEGPATQEQPVTDN